MAGSSAGALALLEEVQLPLREALQVALEIIFMLTLDQSVVGSAAIGQLALAGVERSMFKAGAQGATVAPAAVELGADVPSDDRDPVDEGTAGIPFREHLKHADEDLLHGILVHFGGQLPAMGAAQDERAMGTDDPVGGTLTAVLLPGEDGGVSFSVHGMVAGETCDGYIDEC